MIFYLFLMLATMATAYLVVHLYRAISGTGIADASFSRDSRVVTLSSGNGQWQLGRQQGFVRSDRRVSQPKARAKSLAVKTSKPSIRTPWGW